MPALMLDDQVHELQVDSSTLLDGFAVFCPECGKVWASMPAIGACLSPLGYIRSIKQPCPAHGGGALALFTANTCAYLPLLYGYLPSAALKQIVLSVGE